MKEREKYIIVHSGDANEVTPEIYEVYYRAERLGIPRRAFRDRKKQIPRNCVMRCSGFTPVLAGGWIYSVDVFKFVTQVLNFISISTRFSASYYSGKIFYQNFNQGEGRWRHDISGTYTGI